VDVRTEPFSFEVTASTGPVSAVLEVPADARMLLVLAHGAGAGMRHAFLEALASALCRRAVATLRYQFPYTEAGRRRPDPKPTLHATVVRAIAEGSQRLPDVPLFAGGKSMGGRMTSQIAALGRTENVRGIAFFGFPLHPAGKPPSSERAAHLTDVRPPMLFVQGTRDKLAELELLRSVVRELKGATLHVIDGADHSFAVPKRSGRTPAQVVDEVAETFAVWARHVATRR
jgi:hypothetical protein